MQPQAIRRAAQLVLLVALVGIGATMWGSVAADWRKRDEHYVRKTTGEHGVVVFAAE